MIKILLTAAKIPSLIKIIPPLLIGIAIGVGFSASVDPVAIVLIVLYGWSIQLYIVLMNDFADADSDRLHQKQFPHLIDRRVLTERLLPDRMLLGAGIFFGIITVVIGMIFEFTKSRDFAAVLALGSIAFLWLYSFPPVRLNYRGGGELLEVSGVAVVLPFSAFYFYGGSIDLFPFISITPLILLSLAQAIGAGLKHRPADQMTGKKTVSVLLGENVAKRIMTGSMVLTLLFCLLLIGVKMLFWGTLVGGVILPLLFSLRKAIREHKAAGVNNLEALRRYKSALSHYFITLNCGLIWDFLIL